MIAFALALIAAAAFAEPCKIRITDKGNGWPVPGVELRTTHHVRLVSDNAGIIACDIPELMGKETWFTVIGHGYGVSKDGFGYAGVRLTPQPGKALSVEVTRHNVAKRLGRLTGAGLLAERARCGDGDGAPETGVLGCDTVGVAPYQGKLFWLWGDTTLAHHPLGLFDTLGATSPPTPLTTFEPPIRLPYDHFRNDKGRPRNIAKLPGSGPTWLTGLVTLKDAAGKERLGAVYTKIKPPLETYETGLCVWNDGTQNFEVLKTLWRKGDAAPKPVMPDWHPIRFKDGDATRILFCNPLPTLSCPDTFEAWQDPAQWQAHKPQEKIMARDGKAEVKPHSGSIVWSERRQKWVTVFMEKFGKPSVFGEVWYAESDSPFDGWGRAVKILTHDNYTFYNIMIDHLLTPPDADFLLFEGTYTMQFADHAPPTPRWDYNQVLYRLDFKDVE
ncbi:MAG: hypothetical protein FWG50_10560 [Kiritimatiellaeota bacterium]|nr:hypothetical protein [Kiritimatiellota bacterium]